MNDDYALIRYLRRLDDLDKLSIEDWDLIIRKFGYYIKSTTHKYELIKILINKID